MIEAPHYSAAGKKHAAAFALPAELFDGTVNEAVLHDAVTSYMGNQRQGTHKVKRRQEVSGGNQKPWKQKGTGRARQGTTRAPHWRGGGVVFGPAPRDYRTNLPRKVRQLARQSALNARAREGMLRVIDPITMEAPKTKGLLALIDKLSLGDVRTLVLTAGSKPAVYLSARNAPNVSVLPFSDATAYEILHAHAVVIESSALGAPEADEAPTKAKRTRTKKESA
jgi:large subunit ribosomal protein L4